MSFKPVVMVNSTQVTIKNRKLVVIGNTISEGVVNLYYFKEKFQKFGFDVSVVHKVAFKLLFNIINNFVSRVTNNRVNVNDLLNTMRDDGALENFINRFRDI